jgi:hypothetical protein
MAVTISGDNTAATPGFSGADTDTGIVAGTDKVEISTGGTSRAQVDSQGVFRVGNTATETNATASRVIRVGDISGIVGYTGGTLDDRLHLTHNWYSDGSNNKYIKDGHASFLSLRVGEVRMGSATASGTAGGNITTLSTKFRVQQDGHVKIEDGDLIVGTSGHGIDFSAQAAPTGSPTSQSELLSYYETGTWTPTCSDGTLDDVACRYTRVGHIVHLSGQVKNFSERSTTGDISLTNLPYVCNAESVGSAIYYRVANTDDGMVNALVNTSEAIKFLVSSQGSSESWFYLDYNDLNASNSQIKFCITYRTAV